MRQTTRKARPAAGKPAVSVGLAAPATAASLDLQQLQRRAAASRQSQAATALQLRADASVQRMGGPEEEELQGKFADSVQRMGGLEDEELQGKFADSVQRMGGLEDEELQGKFAGPVQREAGAAATAAGATGGGLPGHLQAGLESLSGHDMSDVRVHYNSSAPASVGALAYTQGSTIHVAPGQEQHLGHEAWHTVQQRQGRVQPTGSVAGLPLNDDPGLEREADVMGARAASEGVRQNRLARDGEG
ncbi:MAG: DUF4157 domain-containing protein [Alphaproteobacteria bacterium]|nr:DUF4157 domain-containing protein [Alphaproteobacteria bacterium]MCB9931648.1 DUF4157 domain-containing protein [Alphaproteobacteria bacterium]